MMPRQPSCQCGTCAKCRHRIAMHELYQSMSSDERRELVKRRNPEKVRSADRARYQRDKPKRRAAMDAYAQTEAGQKATSEAKRRWAERNPDKRKAQAAVADAVRRGVLTKQPCVFAGPDCKGRVEAHHHDYAKPLDVFWLCRKHHRDQHA